MIEAVVFDWAGTTVDFGSFAPVIAMQKAFASLGVEPTTDEIRAPMGLNKKAHIEAMLAQPRLASLLQSSLGSPPDIAVVDAIYQNFEQLLFAELPEHSELLPAVLEVMSWLRLRGIAIGSTTGYTRAMMESLSALARLQGYVPDCLVCAEDVDGMGRPYPYMLWRNLQKLKISSAAGTLKVGDTASDMAEAKNAGCLAVAVIRGSSLLGLSAEELGRLEVAEIEVRFADAGRRFFAAGADYVLDELAELPKLIEALDSL